MKTNHTTIRGCSAFGDGPHSICGVCSSLSKSTSYLSLCLSPNSFYETSRSWASSPNLSYTVTKPVGRKLQAWLWNELIMKINLNAQIHRSTGTFIAGFGTNPRGKPRPPKSGRGLNERLSPFFILYKPKENPACFTRGWGWSSP